MFNHRKCSKITVKCQLISNHWQKPVIEIFTWQLTGPEGLIFQCSVCKACNPKLFLLSHQFYICQFENYQFRTELPIELSWTNDLVIPIISTDLASMMDDSNTSNSCYYAETNKFMDKEIENIMTSHCSPFAVLLNKKNIHLDLSLILN